MNIIFQFLTSAPSLLSVVLSLFSALIGGAFVISGIFIKDYLDKQREKEKETKRIENLKEELKLAIQFFIEKIENQKFRLKNLIIQLGADTNDYNIEKRMIIEDFTFNSIANQDIIKIFKGIKLESNDISLLKFQTDILKLNSLTALIKDIIDEYYIKDNKLIEEYRFTYNEFYHSLNIYARTYNKNDTQILNFIDSWRERIKKFNHLNNYDFLVNIIEPTTNELSLINRDIELYKILKKGHQAKNIIYILDEDKRFLFRTLILIHKYFDEIKKEFERIVKLFEYPYNTN